MSPAGSDPREGDGRSGGGAAWLRPCAQGAGEPRAPVRLPAGGRLLVGRDPACDLCVADPSLSRRHALLTQEGGVWFVVDQGSANGTYVNGSPVVRQSLRGGETLRFGASLAYTFTPEGPARAARRTLASPAALLCPALVSRDPRVKRGPLLLGRKLTVVGRDATADLVLPLPQISGIHARIERRGPRLVVTDAASMNGTSVNGEAVRERALRPGDRICFGDVPFDVVLTPVPSVYGAVLLLVLALGVVGFLLHPSLLQRGGRVQTLWTRADYVDQASRSVAAALRAYGEKPRNETVARAQFDIAIRSLVAADRLPPDTQTDAELRAALRACAKGAGGGRDPFDAYDDLLHPKPPAPEPAPQVAQAPPPAAEPAPSPTPPEPQALAAEGGAGAGAAPLAVEGAGAPADDTGAVLDRELSLIFAEFGIDTQEEPLPPSLVETVERCVDFWTQQRRDGTLRAIRRSAQYLPMIQGKLARAKIPAVFAYLPFVESAFVTGAESGAHAVGLWQLMAGTARDYGLRVDGQVDERNDPERATDAACKHLAMLLMRYGTNDCLCAVAAYNKGDNGLLNCLLKSGVDWRSDRKFWDLVSKDASCLPQETRDYVPRFLAAVVVMRRPAQFGLGAD